MMKKLTTGILFAALFLVLVLTAAFSVIATDTAYADDNTYTVAGSDIKGWYAYRDRDTNEIENSYTQYDGISIRYSGGRDYMMSGLYSSVDGGKMNLLFNRKSSTLTFKSEYSNRPIKAVRISFQYLPENMIYALENNHESSHGDIEVNNGKWTRHMYVSDYVHYTVGHEEVTHIMYGLELSGPPALSVSMQNYYNAIDFQIGDIVQIQFFYADDYTWTADEGIYGEYAENGGYLFSSRNPFIVKSGDEVVSVAYKNGENDYKAELLSDPTGKTYQAVYTGNSITVTDAEVFNMAIDKRADYLTKIILGNDIELQNGFTVSKDVEIDLNGHTLSLNADAENKTITITENMSAHYGAKLNFTDSSDDQDGLLTGFNNIYRRVNGVVRFNRGRYDLPEGVNFGYFYSEIETGFYRIYDNWHVNQDMIIGAFKCKEADGWVEVYPHVHQKVEHDDLNADGSITKGNAVCTTCGDTFEGYTMSAEVAQILIDELYYGLYCDHENDQIYLTITCYRVNYEDIIQKYSDNNAVITAAYKVMYSPVSVAIPTTRLGDCGDCSFSARVGTKTIAGMYVADESLLENPTWTWDENNNATLTATCSVCHNEYRPRVYRTDTYINKEPTVNEEGEVLYVVYAQLNGQDVTDSKTQVLRKLVLVHVDAVSHTCDTDGNIEHWYDEGYGWYYADSEGTQKITDIVDPARHHYTNVWSWSDDNKANLTFTCGVCDDEQVIAARVSFSHTTIATPYYKGVYTYTATAEFEGNQYRDTKIINYDWTYEKTEAKEPNYFEDGNIEYYYGSDRVYYAWDDYYKMHFQINDYVIPMLTHKDVNLSALSSFAYDDAFMVTGNGNDLIIYSTETNSPVTLTPATIVYKFMKIVYDDYYAISLIDASTKQTVAVLKTGYFTDDDDLATTLNITHEGYNAIQAALLSDFSAGETLYMTSGTGTYTGNNVVVNGGDDDDEDGVVVQYADSLDIYAQNGMTLDRVVFHVVDGDVSDAETNHGDISVIDDNTFTVTNINHDSVMISSDYYLTIESIDVYYTVNYTKIAAIPATITEDGNTEYYKGSDGKYYALDNGAYVRIAKYSWIIPAEYNLTAEVSTTDWSNAGSCDTAFAPAVVTADGRKANMYQAYELDASGASLQISQEIEGLANGDYIVTLYANTCYTPGRGFDTSIQEGATDVVYVFANAVKQYIPALFAEKVRPNGEYTLTVTLTDTDNGVLRIGLVKEKAGTNWKRYSTSPMKKWKQKPPRKQRTETPNIMSATTESIMLCKMAITSR